MTEEEKMAMEDALRDIEAEDARESSKEEFIRQCKLQYIASFNVENPRIDVTEHGIIKEIAKNKEEALGMMYMELSESFGYDDGWSPPSIIMDDSPCLMIPGLGLPITAEMESLFDEPPCPTCGDPEGACENPAMCIQNPNQGGVPVEDEDA